MQLGNDHVVLAGVHVGFAEHAQEATTLPGDVVLPAERLVTVLDAVDVAVPPDLAEVVREGVPVLAHHGVDVEWRHVVGERPVEVDEHGTESARAM